MSKHGVDGLSLSALGVGDRVEVLTNDTHWVLDKLTSTHFWWGALGSDMGPTRITPLGSTEVQSGGTIATDWIQEKQWFVFHNHRDQATTVVGPITLLVWKKDYHLPLDPQQTVLPAPSEVSDDSAKPS